MAGADGVGASWTVVQADSRAKARMSGGLSLCISPINYRSGFIGPHSQAYSGQANAKLGYSGRIPHGTIRL